MNSKHNNPTPISRCTNGTPPFATHLLKLLTIFLTLSAAACSSQQGGDTSPTSEAGKTICNSDKDCKTAGGICNTTTHYCDNPSRCDKDSQCLGGYQCNNHTCKKSLCDERCEKGVCSLTEKNKCVSKSACTPATAELDCVGTDICYKKSCQPIDSVKAVLDCGGQGGAPGVFNNSKSDPKCVDKEQCTHDNECTSNYCDKTLRECAPNGCKKPDEACSKGGVCTRDNTSPNGYTCENKSTCSKAKDCADGYLCVKQSSTADGTCLPKKDVPTACNQGCRGNQTCEYDENSFVASCKESASCQNDIDCLGEKTCDSSDNACKTQNPSPQCTQDTIDQDSTKENITSTPTSDLENLILCGNDTDTYTYHVDEPATGEKKSLIVTVNINKADVNTRDIILEVGTTSSDTVTQSNIVNGQPTSSITVTVPITGENTYAIKVKGESHQDKPVDVHYSLTAKVVDTSSVAVCAEGNIETLAHGVETTGNFENAHKGLATSCATGSENAYSRVYKLEITERSYAEINLIQEQGNLALSLRTSCYNQYTEVGCSDNKNLNGEKEQVAKVLNPGTYYVVVTSNSLSQQENAYYKLQTTIKATICSVTEPATCTDDGKLRRCNDSETDHIAIDCQGGCTQQPGGAVCNGREGDTCLNPIQIVADEHSTKQKKDTIKVNDRDFYSNSYVATCNNSNLNSPSDFSNVTQGKEIVFRANVAAGEAVIGSLSGYGQKSAYIVESCAHPINQCLTAVAQERKSSASTTLNFYWKNDTSDAKDVFIILDRDGDPFSEQPIDYDIKIETPQCAPGETKCGSNATGDEGTLYTCKGDATGWDSYKCENECTTEGGTTAHCKNEPTAASCSSPKAVKFENGTYTYSIDLNDTKLGAEAKPSNGPTTNCGNIRYYASKERDAVFKLEATGHDTYTIKAKPTQQSGAIRPTIWIAKENPSTSICSTTGELAGEQCINGVAAKEGTTASLTFAPEEGNYFIVVTSELDLVDDDKKAMPKKLDVTFTAEAQAGTPFTVEPCKSNSITYYDQYGRSITHSCTCTDGQKECHATPNQGGEHCVDAPLLNKSNKNTGNVSNSLSPSSSNEIGHLKSPREKYRIDQCMFNEDALTETPHGADLFYKFDLDPNKTVKVDFKITDSGEEDTLAAFFQKDGHCGDSQSCTGNVVGRGSQTLYYQNSSGKKEVVYLVVKYAANSGIVNTSDIDFTIDWSIDNLTCAPGMHTCKDNNHLSVCQLSSIGEASLVDYECSQGCEDGFCKVPRLNKGKSCGDAFDAKKGGVFYINPSTERGSGPSLSSTCSLKLGKDEENHYFMKVEAEKDDIITVTAGSPGEDRFKVILFNACDKIDETCLRGTVTGAEKPSLGQRTITYRADKAGPYYIDLIDVFNTSEQTPYYVSIDVSKKTCDDTSATTCETSSNTLKYCDYGQERQYTCAGSCASTSDSCQTHEGNICNDAISLTSTNKDTVYKISKNAGSHTYTNFLNGVSGGCIYRDQGDLGASGEKYFSVHLDKGDILNVTLSDTKYGSSRYYAFLLKGCSSRECLTSYRPHSSRSDISTLAFKAHESADYILVVDSDRPVSDQGGFKIEHTITKPNTDNSQCVVGQGHCENDSTLVTCNSSGREVNVTCACSVGYCKTVKASVDTCIDAENSNTEAIVSSSRLAYSTIIPFATLTNSINTTYKNESTRTCQLPGSSFFDNATKGNDANYKVIVPAGYKLTANVISTIDSYTDPIALYLTKVCGDISNDSCLAGGGESSPSIEYKAGNTDETLYLGIDFAGGDYDETVNSPRILNVELTPSCDPTTTTPTCKDNQLTFCNPNIGNLMDTLNCACTDGATSCTQPKGNVCADAINLTPTTPAMSTTLTGNLNDHHTNSGPLSGVTPFCRSSIKNNVEGNDVIYKITVPQNTTATITLKSTATPQQDLAMYAVQDCYAPASSCTDATDKSGTGEESITLSNNQNEERTYYIYVDSSKQLKGDANYEIKAEIK